MKAYTLWAEKLRYFTKEKLPESLTPDDVKAFLTFLAVKKKVSASSQNQAFHALLFFFRHVLTIHDGKGKKDRTVPLPDSIRGDLKSQLNRVISLHKETKSPLDL